jgi:uncharacterized protein YutE (UPF0331/DUF86 family)
MRTLKQSGGTSSEKLCKTLKKAPEFTKFITQHQQDINDQTILEVITQLAKDNFIQRKDSNPNLLFFKT